MSLESTIVIADDSSTARMIIRKCLEIVGFSNAKFFEAENGRQAMDFFKDNDTKLLVTDYNMPELDGKGILKELNENNLKSFPVIFITSAGNEAFKKELTKMGADAVLEKPLSPQKLAPVISPFLLE